jgi:hypothetical protein
MKHSHLTIIIAILISSCILNVESFDISSSLKKASEKIFGLNKEKEQNI